MHQKLDIKSLLLRVSEGDEDAFKVLFHAYCHRVNSFATRLTRSQSIGQESVQDVFMKLWLKREALKSVENFEAFLFTIVRNHVYNILRRQAMEAQARSSLQSELIATLGADEDDGMAERKLLLHRVVEGLPQQQRRVFQLCQLQGFKYQEAASLLNISRLTVKAHMQQALRTIRVQVGRLILTAIGMIFCQL